VAVQNETQSAGTKRPITVYIRGRDVRREGARTNGEVIPDLDYYRRPDSNFFFFAKKSPFLEIDKSRRHRAGPETVWELGMWGARWLPDTQLGIGSEEALSYVCASAKLN
jgi:hypothetical protein